MPTTILEPREAAGDQAAVAVLLALSLCHLLNDTMQSLLAALYPVFKENYDLSFTQIGVLTLAFQVTASLLQPVVGAVLDRRPFPRLLSGAMGSTFVGLLVLAWAGHYWLLVMASAMVGLGSAVFHPESSRIARAASGGRYGLAQSVFQVGGNAGSAIGPLLAAYLVLPRGQSSVAWFSVAALAAMGILWWVGGWARGVQLRTVVRRGAGDAVGHDHRARRQPWPGIRRHPFKKHIYIADRKVVRFLHREIFHLLGYRILAAQGNYIEVVRRDL